MGEFTSLAIGSVAGLIAFLSIVLRMNYKKGKQMQGKASPPPH